MFSNFGGASRVNCPTVNVIVLRIDAIEVDI